ncbi:MAG: hypothetical protein AAF664_00225 [Planctomycetota bacterium]
MNASPTFNVKAALESQSCFRAELQVFLLTPDQVDHQSPKNHESGCAPWTTVWTIIEQRLAPEIAIDFILSSQDDWIESAPHQRGSRATIEFWIAGTSDSKLLRRWIEKSFRSNTIALQNSMRILATDRSDAFSHHLWHSLAIGTTVNRVEDLLKLTPAFKRLVKA